MFSKPIIFGAHGIQYLTYLLIYVSGSDGAANYFWVNNDLFFLPLMILGFLVMAAVLIDFMRTRKLDNPRKTGWSNVFLSLLLAAGFPVFAFGISLADYGLST